MTGWLRVYHRPICVAGDSKLEGGTRFEDSRPQSLELELAAGQLGEPIPFLGDPRYYSVRSPPITVQGTLTIGDLAQYQYYHFYRRGWPFSLVLVCLEMLAIPLVHYSSYNALTFIVDSSIFVVSFVAGLSVMPILPYTAARKQYASQILLNEADSYTFTPGEIEYSGKSASSQMLWSIVREIRETKSLFLLYHAHNLVMILLKRFVLDAREMAVWRSLAALLARLKNVRDDIV